MRLKARKLFISILKELSILLVIILFLLAIGVITNFAMDITISKYMMNI